MGEWEEGVDGLGWEDEGEGVDELGWEDEGEDWIGEGRESLSVVVWSAGRALVAVWFGESGSVVVVESEVVECALSELESRSVWREQIKVRL